MERDPDGLEMNAGLFASTLALGSAFGVLTVFDATIAESPTKALANLTERIGPVMARRASVGRLNPHDPLVAMLLSKDMIRHLVRIAHDPWSPLASGFQLHVEYRMGS